MKLAGYERYVVAPTCLMQNFRKLHSCFLHQHSQIRFIFLVQGHSERHIEKLLSSSTLRLHRIKYCLEQPNQEYLKNIRKKKRRGQSAEDERKRRGARQQVSLCRKARRKALMLPLQEKEGRRSSNRSTVCARDLCGSCRGRKYEMLAV